MKGKNIFTIQERDIIEKQLNVLRSNIVKSEQKKIRQELRNMSFYISDFRKQRSGFTCSDFLELIEKGEISIF